MPTNEAMTYSSKRAAELAGVTFRQVDYWSRTGVTRRQAGGSGSRRRWSHTEVVLMAAVGVYSEATGDLDAVREDPEGLLTLVEAGASMVAKVGPVWRSLDGANWALGAQGPLLTVMNLDVVRAAVEGRRRGAALAALAFV